jgi:hypothetical protein
MSARTTMQSEACLAERHASVAFGAERHAGVTLESEAMKRSGAK